jgi:hypothetical protein
MGKDDISEESYHVMTVEKSAAPEGMPGNDWHHYVIGRGSSIIEGKKTGTLKDVTEHAKDLAERINARCDKNGITYVSTYTPRKKS